MKIVAALAALLILLPLTAARAERNLALQARVSTSYVSGHESLDAINDGFEPRAVNDHSHGCYGNWPATGTQWVQYEWPQPVSTSRMEVYWWDDSQGVRLPTACRLLYWDGQAFAPVKSPVTVGVVGGRYNALTFAPVRTTRLRLEIDGRGSFSTGIIEWKVYDAGGSPKFPPRVSATGDGAVIVSSQAHLRATVRGDADSRTWQKLSGPGEVRFGDAHASTTTAQFSRIGVYTVRFSAADGPLTAQATLRVSVEAPPPASHLTLLEPRRFSVSSTFWQERLKSQIVSWIPHCVEKLSDPALPEGGVGNFVQAANKLAGRRYQPNIGPPWSNAYVYNTVESMCLALMVDARGDQEILRAQAAMRRTLDEWIPTILAAQEPDGYLHTQYTLSGQKRWSNKGDHEGYCAGYFIEAAIAHYLMTDGKDRRMLDAARKLADCWNEHIGPAPKQAWYDGHEELEQALVRLAWFLDKHEGPHSGDRYVRLSKFLLDQRGRGETYDQSHLPVTEQTEAVGHAVRAVYLYSGMAGVAMETNDVAYQSALKALWDDLINRKYYVTGGVGSGESSEGFGKDYSLPNSAYCESCSSCGEIMFQNKLQLTYHDARYADLLEETLYNALLGSVDLDGRNFTYTNPLDSASGRYPWHSCPCCVGNIPRTLLMLPTWMYSTGADGIYVNLYAGSKVSLGDVELTQTTDYPWSGSIGLTIDLQSPKRIPIRLRIPQHNASELYTSTPEPGGPISISVNGKPIKVAVQHGYAVIDRTWHAGDRVAMELPMRVQRVHASDQVKNLNGRVALRLGPLVYNIESVDQNVDSVLRPDAPLTTEWRPDLLGGVTVIRGTFANGSQMTAIPNYARLNRQGRSIVWIREK